MYSQGYACIGSPLLLICFVERAPFCGATAVDGSVPTALIYSLALILNLGRVFVFEEDYE